MKVQNINPESNKTKALYKDISCAVISQLNSSNKTGIRRYYDHYWRKQVAGHSEM